MRKAFDYHTNRGSAGSLFSTFQSASHMLSWNFTVLAA